MAHQELVVNLSARERTRQEILWEVVASEERFVQSLCSVILVCFSLISMHPKVMLPNFVPWLNTTQIHYCTLYYRPRQQYRARLFRQNYLLQLSPSNRLLLLPLPPQNFPSPPASFDRRRAPHRPQASITSPRCIPTNPVEEILLPRIFHEMKLIQEPPPGHLGKVRTLHQLSRVG